MFMLLILNDFPVTLFASHQIVFLLHYNQNGCILQAHFTLLLQLQLVMLQQMTRLLLTRKHNGTKRYKAISNSLVQLWSLHCYMTYEALTNTALNSLFPRSWHYPVIILLSRRMKASGSNKHRGMNHHRHFNIIDYLINPHHYCFFCVKPAVNYIGFELKVFIII